MKRWQQRIIKTPAIGRVALFLYRSIEAVKFHRSTLRNIAVWLFTSNETTNHTYELDPSNVRHLSCLIAELLDVDYALITSYIDELLSDDELHEHIRSTTERSDRRVMADTHARYGRRLGWYAVTRATKPSVVVETGVDKGLGACVLTAALIRNRDEGYPGKYYGMDINPAAGYLLSGKYADFGEIIFGDSLESIASFTQPIDLFINDSDHSAIHEGREYQAVNEKLSAQGIILGDNSDVTDELLDFSMKSGRRFVFFSEKPARHWFPGGGIGFSLAPQRPAATKRAI